MKVLGSFDFPVIGRAFWGKLVLVRLTQSTRPFICRVSSQLMRESFRAACLWAGPGIESLCGSVGLTVD